MASKGHSKKEAKRLIAKMHRETPGPYLIRGFDKVGATVVLDRGWKPYPNREVYSAPQNQDHKSVNLRWPRLLVFVLADRPFPASDTLTLGAIARGYKTRSSSSTPVSLPQHCGSPSDRLLHI